MTSNHDAAAREFRAWLSERLPETIFPSKQAALRDSHLALLEILRQHFQPPASEPAKVDLLHQPIDDDQELWRIVMVSEEGLPSPDSEGLWHDGEKFWAIVEFGDHFAGYSLNRIGIAGHLLESLPQHRHWHRAVPSSKVAAIVEREYPKLIESGPLPEGRVYVRVKGEDACPVILWPEHSVNSLRANGWKFYDYGPLPDPQETSDR